MPNATEPAEASTQGLLSQLIGMVLALAAGAVVAYSMTLQRYALAYPSPKVPLLGIKWRRQRVWGVGIAVYTVGNGLYTAALIFGPLSLLGGVFTTLLAFNLFFAHTLLGEELTRRKVVGALVIFIGATLSLVGSPSESDVRYKPEEVEAYMTSGGAIYLAGMVLTLIACSVAILWYERRPAQPMQPGLDALMGLIYPASLGLDEGIAHLSMRAVRNLSRGRTLLVTPHSPC